MVHIPFNPICLVEHKTNELCSEFSNNSIERVADCEYRKVLYADIYGKIRAFCIKREEIYPMRKGFKVMEKMWNYDTILICDVAGIGEMRIGITNPYLFTVYDSVEDYKQETGRKLKTTYVSNDKIKNIVEVLYGVTILSIGSSQFQQHKTFRYYWDGVKPATFEYSIPLYFTYDAYNGYLDPSWWDDDTECGYTTAEECKADNEVEVAEFDNDPKAKQEVEPSTIKVTIASMEIEIPKDKIADLEEFLKSLG